MRWIWVLLSCLGILSGPQPAMARLGETKIASKKIVLKAKPDARYILYYSNAKGIVLKEYWEAYEQLWPVEEADKYRELIMGPIQPSGVDRAFSTRTIFFYDNGSRVIYSLLGGRVVCIIAISKEYREYPM